MYLSVQQLLTKSTLKLFVSRVSWGQSCGTGIQALTLHVADSILIPSTTYGSSMSDT